MTEDGSRAERAGALLEASGVAAGGIAPGEAVRRADEMDTAVTPVSQTIGRDQVVDELVMSFTHVHMDFILPGVPPSGRPVELAVAAVVGVRDGRVSHEHIYWDQASILVQVGALDSAGLPVTGPSRRRRCSTPPCRPTASSRAGELGADERLLSGAHARLRALAGPSGRPAHRLAPGPAPGRSTPPGRCRPA